MRLFFESPSRSCSSLRLPSSYLYCLFRESFRDEDRNEKKKEKKTGIYVAHNQTRISKRPVQVSLFSNFVTTMSRYRHAQLKRQKIVQ